MEFYYLMLESALVFRKVFELLSYSDNKFKDVMIKQYGILVREDWDAVASFLPFLKLFYDVTLKVSATLNITSNVYLHELLGVGVMIKSQCNSLDIGIKLMAIKMKKKHEKYWENINNINALLYITVVLDPRYKMQYVNWAIGQQFEDKEKAINLCGVIKEILENLFDVYANQQQPAQLTTSRSNSYQNKELDFTDDISKFMELEFAKEAMAGVMDNNKSELTMYLEDRLELSMDFDILDWWKRMGCRFPILALMARDVLAIPVSTVASESAFSTSGHVLDSFRSSLSPKIVEALLCAQDWIRSSRHPLIIEEVLEEIEKIEEDFPFSDDDFGSIEDE